MGTSNYAPVNWVVNSDSTPDPSRSTQTHTLYNLNDNLLMYAGQLTCAAQA